jgi:zinc and cadmium transporter
MNLMTPLPVLLWIVACTSLIGLTTVGVAAFTTFKLKAKILERMVSFSIGLMLATSLLHALPEALDNTVGISTQALCITLLGSILGFFLLQKMALMRHNHHHEHDGHDHHHGHDARLAGSGGWLILLGSSVHNFTDGILIAAAFIADIRLGLLTALAIAAHEIPHKLSDFVILLNAGFSKKRALLMDLLSSVTVVLGGVLGWWLLGSMHMYVPYLLMIAAGSFIYIAMSDLIPYVQHESRVRDVLPQIILIALGILLVWRLNTLNHSSELHHSTDHSQSIHLFH